MARHRLWIWKSALNWSNLKTCSTKNKKGSVMLSVEVELPPLCHEFSKFVLSLLKISQSCFQFYQMSEFSTL